MFDATDLSEALNLLDSLPSPDRCRYATKWWKTFVKDQLNEVDFLNFKIPELRQDRIAGHSIELLALIGEGQFGKVYLGRLHGQRWVAVKFVHASLVSSDEHAARNVLRERFTCRVLDAAQIDGVVGYLGFVDDGNIGERGLVFELCADLRRVRQMAEAASNRHGIFDLGFLPDWTHQVSTSLRTAVVFQHQ